MEVNMTNPSTAYRRMLPMSCSVNLKYYIHILVLFFILWTFAIMDWIPDWHRDNTMIVSVPVKQPWRIRVNKQHKSTESYEQNQCNKSACRNSLFMPWFTMIHDQFVSSSYWMIFYVVIWCLATNIGVIWSNDYLSFATDVCVANTL